MQGKHFLVLLTLLVAVLGTAIGNYERGRGYVPNKGHDYGMRREGYQRGTERRKKDWINKCVERYEREYGNSAERSPPAYAYKEMDSDEIYYPANYKPAFDYARLHISDVIYPLKLGSESGYTEKGRYGRGKGNAEYRGEEKGRHGYGAEAKENERSKHPEYKGKKQDEEHQGKETYHPPKGEGVYKKEENEHTVKTPLAQPKSKGHEKREEYSERKEEEEEKPNDEREHYGGGEYEEEEESTEEAYNGGGEEEGGYGEEEEGTAEESDEKESYQESRSEEGNEPDHHGKGEQPADGHNKPPTQPQPNQMQPPNAAPPPQPAPNSGESAAAQMPPEPAPQPPSPANPPAGENQQMPPPVQQPPADQSSDGPEPCSFEPIATCSAFSRCSQTGQVRTCWSQANDMVFDKTTQGCRGIGGMPECQKDSICTGKPTGWTAVGGGCTKVAYMCGVAQQQATNSDTLICLGNEVVNPADNGACVDRSQVQACAQPA